MVRGVTKLLVSIRSEADAKGFTDSEKAASRWERGLSQANTAANVAIAGLVTLGKVTSDSASRAEQAAGAVESVFRGQADAVDRLAATAANRVGLATSQYGELASVIGAQLRNLGVAEGELVGTTDDLITRGADLAATFGGTTADAVSALSALMRGERDPIERYGVSIKQADIDARLAADGLDKLTGEARRQAETQATLALLTEQTADASGQFAREVDSAAGSAQIAAATYENAKAALGEALLPVLVLAAEAAANLAGVVQDNATAFTVAGGVVLGLALAIKLINTSVLVYTATHKALTVVLRVGTAETVRHRVATLASTAAQRAATVATLAAGAAQRALNLAMRANPIGLVITLIAGLVAIIVTAYQRSERFRQIVQTVGRVLVTAFKASPIMLVVRAVQLLIDGVRSVIGWISRIRFPEPPGWLRSIGGAIGGLFGASDYAGPLEPGFQHTTMPGPAGGPRLGFMATPGGGSAAAALAALAGGAGGPSGVTIINVSGALDPDAVARQIERLLARRGARTGRGVLTGTLL